MAIDKAVLAQFIADRSEDGLEKDAFMKGFRSAWAARRAAGAAARKKVVAAKVRGKATMARTKRAMRRKEVAAKGTARVEAVTGKYARKAEIREARHAARMKRIQSGQGRFAGLFQRAAKEQPAAPARKWLWPAVGAGGALVAGGAYMASRGQRPSYVPANY